MSDEPIKIAVKRDGPRGWHWIAAESFDPAVHELHDGQDAPANTPDHTHAPADYEVADNSESFTDPHGTHDVDPAPKAAKKRRVAK